MLQRKEAKKILSQKRPFSEGGVDDGQGGKVTQCVRGIGGAKVSANSGRVSSEADGVLSSREGLKTKMGDHLY